MDSYAEYVCLGDEHIKLVLSIRFVGIQCTARLNIRNLNDHIQRPLRRYSDNSGFSGDNSACSGAGWSNKREAACVRCLATKEQKKRQQLYHVCGKLPSLHPGFYLSYDFSTGSRDHSSLCKVNKAGCIVTLLPIIYDVPLSNDHIPSQALEQNTHIPSQAFFLGGDMMMKCFLMPMPQSPLYAL